MMINYGICLQSIVPVRKSPGDKNEMINQLLFGDLVLIKDQVEDWYLIEGAEDQYEGWTDSKQIRTISEGDFKQLSAATKSFVNDITAECIVQQAETPLHLLLGSGIPGLNNHKFKIGNTTYSFNGSFCPEPKNPARNNVVENALKFLHTPYFWGGRSPFGIDCSGLTQVVFKMSGYLLPRDASQQVSSGVNIDFMHETQPGDLAFFSNEEGSIIHVGIILENQKIIHASGCVRIDKIDHQGIFNEKENKYTHHLRIIKRIL